MTLSAARVLTVRQPFASLIALGVKTIEARTWSTDYRGPLIIQAGARSFGGVNSTTAEMIRSWGLATCQRLRTGLGCDPEDCYGYPLGAVVAVVDLVDCLPVEANRPIGEWAAPTRRIIATEGSEGAFMADVGSWGCWMAEEYEPTHFKWQPAYCNGLLVPGAYGWLLDNPRRLEPIPHKGGLGLRHASDELLAAVNQQLEAV